ncbi:MAG: alpha-L-fucosidase [Acidobacteria bacterium]|nr:alpha-L-fucosidase [Acidobacteriota bacterium]
MTGQRTGNLLLASAAFLMSVELGFPGTASGRSKGWSGKDLRRVHTLYVSPPWAENRGKNFDPRKYVRDLKTAGAGTIEFYLKDHHGNAYFKTAVGNFDGKDLLTPLVEESHAQGMNFVAYYSVGWDNWAFHNHPEWRPESPKETTRIDLFLSVDVQSGYLDYMLQHLKDIAAAPVDGWFLDVCCGGPAYGNSTAESQRRIYETIKHLRPNSLVTWNSAGGMDEELNKYSDFSSMEGWRPEAQSFVSRFMRRLDKPFTVESPGSYLGWAGWALKPAALLQLEGAVVSANGGALAVGLNPFADGTINPAEVTNLGTLWKFIQEREEYFINTKPAAEIGILSPSGSKTWWTESWWLAMQGLHEALLDYQIDFGVARAQSDFEKYSLLILPADGKLSGAELERVIRFVEKGGKLLALGRSFAGLEKVLGIEVQGYGELPYTAAYAALKAPELKRNIPDYPVLIRGGAIRTKATTGTSLAKVINPIAEYTPHTFFGWSYPGPRGLGANPPGEETGYDMIVKNRYGQGAAIYVAGLLSEDLGSTVAGQHNAATWLKQLVANMVDMLLPDRLVVASAPPGIELVTNWQANRLVVSLINYYAALPGRFSVGDDRIAKATGITLRVNEARVGKPARVFMQPGNRDLTWERKDGCLEITVPDFLIHAFVVVESHSAPAFLRRDNFELRKSPILVPDVHFVKQLYDARGGYRGELRRPGVALAGRGPSWDDFGKKKSILLDAYRPSRLPMSIDPVLLLEVRK